MQALRGAVPVHSGSGRRTKRRLRARCAVLRKHAGVQYLAPELCHGAAGADTHRRGEAGQADRTAAVGKQGPADVRLPACIGKAGLQAFPALPPGASEQHLYLLQQHRTQRVRANGFKFRNERRCCKAFVHCLDQPCHRPVPVQPVPCVGANRNQ